MLMVHVCYTQITIAKNIPSSFTDYVTMGMPKTSWAMDDVLILLWHSENKFYMLWSKDDVHAGG
jgi:hypothetical protein